MLDFFKALASWLVPVFVITSMLNVGLTQKPSRILHHLRKHWFLLRMVVTNLVIVPALMIYGLKLVPIADVYAAGLVVFSVAARLGLDEKAAAEEVATEDRLRSEISKRMYQWDPNQSDEDFDVVINTGSVTYEEVVALIAGMYRAKYPARAAKAEDDSPDIDSLR